MGGTALYDAIDDARASLDNLADTGEDRIRAIVVLSDGDDNASSITLEQLAANYDEAGVSIFPVAYGEDANMDALNKIAEFSRTIVVQGSAGDIAQIFENLSRYF